MMFESCDKLAYFIKFIIFILVSFGMPWRETQNPYFPYLHFIHITFTLLMGLPFLLFLLIMNKQFVCPHTYVLTIIEIL